MRGLWSPTRPLCHGCRPGLREHAQTPLGMFKKVRPARPQYCLLRPVGRNCLAYPEGKHLCVGRGAYMEYVSTSKWRPAARSRFGEVRERPRLSHPERCPIVFNIPTQCNQGDSVFANLERKNLPSLGHGQRVYLRAFLPAALAARAARFSSIFSNS